MMGPEPGRPSTRLQQEPWTRGRRVSKGAYEAPCAVQCSEPRTQGTGMGKQNHPRPPSPLTHSTCVRPKAEENDGHTGSTCKGKGRAYVQPAVKPFLGGGGGSGLGTTTFAGDELPMNRSRAVVFNVVL